MSDAGRRFLGYTVDEELARTLTVAMALRQEGDEANVVFRALFGALCLARRPLRLAMMEAGVFAERLVPVHTAMSVRYSQMIRDEIPLTKAEVRSELPSFDAGSVQLLERASRSSAPLGVDALLTTLREDRDAHEPRYRSWGLRPSLVDAALARALGLVPHTVEIETALLSGYTADTHAGDSPDLIGGVEREAAAFARVCASREVTPPLAIGVFGPWGSGKSYFMDKVHAQVEGLVTRHKDSGDLFHDNIVQIRFNAWHYIEVNLWASLVEHIFTELDNWLRKDEHPRDAAKVDALFERLSTSRLLKLEAVTELISRRRRKAEAELVLAREHDAYLETLRTRQTKREREFPWTEVVAALHEDPRWRTLDVRRAGETLGIDDLAASGTKLEMVLAQSIESGGRMRMLVNALSARFGRTWPWFILIVTLSALLPFGFALLPRLHWDSIQAMVASACMVLGAVATMIGKGLEAANRALERIESARVLFEDQVRIEQAKLREELTAAEDELGKAEAAVTRAEAQLQSAEAEVAEAAEAFKWGTARGRLNRFIRDKVTSGDYAKHLGLVTSIRRDFVELARLIEAVGDSQTRRETTRFAQDYERRVLATIHTVFEDYEARATPGALAELRAELEALLGERLQLDAPARAATEAKGAETEAEVESGDPRAETLLSMDEIRKLCAGIEAPTADELPAFQRIILYIDDLDRCPPDKVVEVLQAAHLLLGFPLFIVLIAVDERWVSRALARHYHEMIAEPGERNGGEDDSAATSHDYLEKIFQIPYWVRPMAAEASASYIGGLLDAGRRAAPVALPELVAAELAPKAQAASAPERAPDPKRAPDKSGAAPAAERAPVEVVRELEIEAMRLDQHERKFMVELAHCAGDSPRRGKRFINAYRLIKAGLLPNQLGEFVGSAGESAHYRALLVQLAIATGSPRVAPEGFDVLERESDLDGIIHELKANTALRRAEPGEHARMLAALNIARSAGLGAHDLHPWTNLARRHSFVVQREL